MQRTAQMKLCKNAFWLQRCIGILTIYYLGTACPTHWQWKNDLHQTHNIRVFDRIARDMLFLFFYNWIPNPAIGQTNFMDGKGREKNSNCHRITKNSSWEQNSVKSTFSQACKIAKLISRKNRSVKTVHSEESFLTFESRIPYCKKNFKMSFLSSTGCWLQR